jgi:hypothetical protein
MAKHMKSESSLAEPARPNDRRIRKTTVDDPYYEISTSGG